jgi:hypothetical protein
MYRLKKANANITCEFCYINIDYYKEYSASRLLSNLFVVFEDSSPPTIAYCDSERRENVRQKVTSTAFAAPSTGREAMRILMRRRISPAMIAVVDARAATPDCKKQ